MIPKQNVVNGSKPINLSSKLLSFKKQSIRRYVENIDNPKGIRKQDHFIEKPPFKKQNTFNKQKKRRNKTYRP